MAVISLVKPEGQTYEECILEYLDGLTDEEKNRIVTSVVLAGISAVGIFFSVLKEISPLEFLGLLEQLKYFIMLESLGEEDE